MQNTITPATNAEIIDAIEFGTTAGWTFRFFDGRDDIIVMDAEDVEGLAAYYEERGIGLVIIAPIDETPARETTPVVEMDDAEATWFLSGYGYTADEARDMIAHVQAMGEPITSQTIRP
ncbi:hypothetical protein [Nocardia farcinica]|uniref:hypothetical protein n=1 Tax=Nocardia farcinica TaxID=37329 RepID=UPI002458298B|nr:hypothetical protein [Nocardia farcinica]